MNDFQTVLLEPQLDDEIRAEAVRRKLSSAEVFRRRLRAGVRAIKAQRTPWTPLAVEVGALPPVLRMVHIDAALVDWLRWQALDAKVSTAEYIRWCLAQGVRASPKRVRPDDSGGR
jgi:hypothetical protein